MRNKLFDSLLKETSITFSDQSIEIEKRARIMFEDLCRQEENKSRKVKMHTIAQIIPCISVYKSIIEVTGNQEAAYQIIDHYYKRTAKKFEKQIQTLCKIPGVYHFIPSVMKVAFRVVFGESSGFQFAAPHKKETGCVMSVISCPYYNYCSLYDCKELTKIFCDSDDICYGNMHPQIVWRRTKTLGRGNNCCDFRIQLKKKKRRKKWKKVPIFQILFGIIFLGCASYFAINSYLQIRNEKLMEDLRLKYQTEEVKEIFWQNSEDIPQEQETLVQQEIKRVDFVALKEVNEDIYAWIEVPGTLIDYPILQSDTDNYYLDYTVERIKSLPGAIYTNACNKTDFSDRNTVIYGHNMRNGTMFASLHFFEDTEFFNENVEMYIYLSDRKLTYERIAASAYSNAYIPNAFDFKSTNGMEEFLEELHADGSETNHFADSQEISSNDRFVTLSTCIKGQPEKRFVVIFQLISNEIYED